MRAFLALALVGCAYDPGMLTTIPRWGRHEAPLLVCVSHYASDVRDDGLADRAIRSTNDRLGFKAYALARSECDVTIVIGVPAERGWQDPGGVASISTREDGVRCSIATSNTGTVEILSLTLRHELGHCLGLAHDDWTGSIMRRVQVSTPDGQIGPWITDSDRALVRATWGP